MTDTARQPARAAIRTIPPRLIRVGALLVLLQAACTVFFVWDVGADVLLSLLTDTPVPVSPHLLVEATASLSLWLAIGLEVTLLLWLLRRQALLEHDLAMAGSAVEAVVLTLFEDWRLTGAEQDVAMFVVKGLSIAEIAELRGSTEATVKSHLNAIYRKSGSTGRPDLLATILDTLMGRPAGTTPRAAVTS